MKPLDMVGARVRITDKVFGHGLSDYNCIVGAIGTIIQASYNDYAIKWDQDGPSKVWSESWIKWGVLEIISYPIEDFWEKDLVIEI